jgi:energy-coupling factor transporter ATP-binding protein EcfA2
MTKESILEQTHRGLDVFRRFIAGNWQVGKNFKNPHYDDKKASCHVYFDSQSNQYKIKDFGDAYYQGDCFAFVGQINGLDVRDASDFQEIMRLIVQHLDLRIAPQIEAKYPPKTYLRPEGANYEWVMVADASKYKAAKTEPVSVEFEIKTQPMTEGDLLFWRQYGITPKILDRYQVVSIQRFSAINKEGKKYTVVQRESEPIFGYQHKSFVKVYRPKSELRFQFLGQKPDNYIFGLDYLPSRGDVLFITGGEKDVMSLAAHGFSAICFNSENAAIPADVIKKLSYRFRHIVLLYDVDKAGIEAMIHHLKALKSYDLKHLTLPLSGTKQEKDVSDFFRMGKTAEDLKRLFNQLLESLYAQTFAMLRSCEIDFENPPITPKPLITIAGVTVGSPGNLLGITGSEGSGKSNFLGGMLAGALANPTQILDGRTVDSLGTKVLPNYTKKTVLYFDTEQSEDQLYRNLNIVLQRCALSSPPEWFKAYCLTNLSRRERLQVILQSVDKFHHQFGGVHLVVIDGIGDLIGSLNDERESISLVEELHRTAGIYQTCILCVLHLVPNGVKLRGHLGSELQRKSAGILCIEKDENTDVSCVRALKVRSGSPLDVPLIQFAWNKELGYHTYVGEKSKDFKLQRKIEDLTSLAEDVFRETETVTFNDLINALAETMGVKERMSRNYIQFMLESGIVAQLPKTKLYKLGMSVNK